MQRRHARASESRSEGRGATRNERGNERGGGGRAAGVAAAGVWTKPPCHSHPGRPNAARMHAIARRPEMRDMGGGASSGEAGLEVAPPSSREPRRETWEDRSNTSSTWRTFSAHSSCSSRGFRFPHVLGMLGLGWEVGVGVHFGQVGCGSGELSFVGTWVGIQLQTEGSDLLLHPTDT